MAYTNIDDPSAHFQIALYTGTGSAHSIGNDGNSDLKPDWVWIKKRSASGNNSVFDSTRGVYKELVTNGTNAEASDVQLLTQFDTDGFTVGTNSGVNGSSATFAAWQWKANGGTTATNTAGSIDSVVQANQDAGFSIVTYTGGGSAATIGHGLGVKPDVIILKKRNGAVHWYVKHVSTGSSHLVLSLTAAAASVPSVTWTTTEPTSSVFSIGSGADFNANGGTFIAYCFAEKQGYSKFGSYIANANTNGTFVYLGFKPAFIIFKNTQQTTNWAMYDVKRDSFNVATNELQPNTSAAANDDIPYSQIDILSNGIKMRNNNGLHTNANSGQKIIYMAFAENPFVTSTGIPTTAR